MRIRSIHPSYLDQKWLTAVWRETLLAKKVLEGKTKWYKNHPQLDRFKKAQNTLETIHFYLQTIHIEATTRWYNFDSTKFTMSIDCTEKIPVTTWQIEYEFRHLLKKLSMRDPKQYEKIIKTAKIKANPIFKIITWDIESFEKI